MTAFSLEKGPFRRIAFVAGNLLVAFAIVAAVVSPIRTSLIDGDAEIVRQIETLSRFKAMAQQRPDAPAPDEAALTADLFQSGPNEGVAAANLQARLKTMSETAGARVRLVQSLPARSEGTLRYIGAKLEIFGPLAAVHRAIQAVESAKPFLFVTNSTLKLSPIASRPGNTADPTIEAQLDIIGAFKPQEPR
jgi:general secretion pathway protein M